jgi:hypothetical protein
LISERQPRPPGRRGTRFAGSEPGVQLVELPAKQRLRRQQRLILGHQRWRGRARERVLDDPVVLGGAQQDPDRRPLVGFLHVAVERLDVEAELSEVSRLELADLELEGDQAGQTPMEEHQVDREVLVPDLDRILGADEAEVAPELGDEAAEIVQQRAVEIGFGVTVAQVEKL